MKGSVEHRRGEGEGESAELFDYALLKAWAGFVVRGIRRHRVVSAVAFVLVAAAGVAVTMTFPRQYHVEAKLLANRTQLIRALGNPRSGVQSEDPTRAAQEQIFARDNLVSLVKQTNLVQGWEATRHPLLRVKDRLSAAINGPMSDEDKLDAMVGTLEKKLKVHTDAMTVTIGIDWPDAMLAYQLVEAAQQNFLETRHVTEMSAISEALSILEVHASQVQKSVDEALSELERVREARRKGGRPAAAPPQDAPSEVMPQRPEPTASQLATEQELAQIRFLIQAKRRAIADLEDFRARRLSELSAQLAEQKVEYADQHPVVLDTRQRIASLQQDSPQLLTLRADEHELIAEYKRKGGLDPDALVEPRRPRLAPRSAPAAAGTAQPALSQAELADDPVVDHARNNLRMATAKYEELVMRIDAAKIELDTARAAFKYRYSVVRPAALPKRAAKPDVQLMLAASFVAALVLALVAGAALDLWRGRVVESWQVERALGLKVLGEVRRS